MTTRTLQGALALAALLASAAGSCKELTLYLMEVPPLTLNEPTRKGVVGDIVIEAIRRAGHTPKLVVVPSARAMTMVQSEGSRDELLIPLARQSAREDHYTWIAPVIKVNRAFFALERNVNSFADARASLRHIAVARGTAGVNILREQGFSDTQIYQVADTVAGAKMLLLGRVDAWYGPALQFREWQRSEDPKRRAKMGTPLGATFNYLACSLRCDPLMRTQLADAIAKMRKDGSIKAIETRYGIGEQ
jgi:polar amino acid transport system substrate-binding protein